jgi:hypothetical protein
MNNQLIELGFENVNDVLTENDKINILNQKEKCLYELIKIIHTSNDFPQFHNVSITNIHNSIGYKYNNELNEVIDVPKKELLADIIKYRLNDIYNFYDQVKHLLNKNVIDKFDEFHHKVINEPKYYNNVMEEVKLVLFNYGKRINKRKKINK